MKVNLPGLGGIGGLVLAHGEKALIAVVAACVLWMMVKSLGRETLPDDRQASRLQSAVSNVSSQIDSFTWEMAVKEFPENVRLPQRLENNGDLFVDPKAYTDPVTGTVGRNPPVVPPTVRRSDPVLLAVTDVEATGQSGLLAFTNDAIRQERLLAQQRRAAQEQQRQQQQQQRAADEQPGRTPRRGAAVDDGRGPIDPAHPNRRPLGGGAAGSLGLPLAGDEEVKLAYWAVVVAKVPIKEQMKLYQDAFANARGYNPSADIPQYLGYMVERAEVRPGVDDADLNWEQVRVYNGKGQQFGPVVTQKVLFGDGQQQAGAAPGAAAKPTPSVTSDWASGSGEVVDPRFIDPGGTLTFPLPPLTGRNWGREVTHSDIPLAEDAVELEQEALPEDAQAPADGADDDAFGGIVGGPGGMQPGIGGGRGFGGPPRGGRFGGEFGGRGMGLDMGMGMGGRGVGGEGFMGGPRGGMGMGADGMPQVSEWLLRFFDFSVQPGKKYKYRVRLALLDPNQSFGPRFVNVDWLDRDALERVRAERAKPGAAKKTPVRMTNWSEPSRTASIPLAGNVHLASARPPVEQNFTDEPRASLLVESFSADDKGKAIQGSRTDEYRRGFVANRKAEGDVILNEDGQQFVDKIKDFQFRTGITVLDIRGGERLTGRDNTRPARVLLMDPAGQLFVQKELDDKEAVEMHKAIFSEEADAARGFMGGRGGDFGGEFGGPGGRMPGRGR